MGIGNVRFPPKPDIADIADIAIFDPAPVTPLILDWLFQNARSDP